jgi:hypothetical protein
MKYQTTLKLHEILNTINLYVQEYVCKILYLFDIGSQGHQK